MADLNPHAFSQLIGDLFGYFGNCHLAHDELLQRMTRSLRKNKECGDLFLPFTRCDEANVRLCVDGNIVINISQASKDVLKISKEWPIPISTCSVSLKGFGLCFNRLNTFRAVMQEVLSQGNNYGKSPTNCHEYAVIRCWKSDSEVVDLSQHRVTLAVKVVKNLLQAVGFEVNPKTTEGKESKMDFYFTHKSTDNVVASGSKLVTCGVVLNAETGCKENCYNVSDHYRHWEEVIFKLSQERESSYSVDIQSEVNSHIAKAAVLFDLLGIKLSSCVTLKLPTIENNQCYGTSSKGAAFVLYNTARLASIRSQFLTKVDTGNYPKLPPLETIDLSLLNSEEEWSLLRNFILIFPQVIKESLVGLSEGKPNLHNFLAFINGFCKEISGYYRRTRILTEARSQLLPIMFARLYLLQSIEQVLHNALGILDVKPLLHM